MSSCKVIKYWNIWKMLLWRISSLIKIPFQRPVSRCVVRLQTVRLEKVAFFPLRAWLSISCEKEYTVLWEYKRKKTRFYHNEFCCLCTVLMCKGQGTVWEGHSVIWKRHYLTQHTLTSVLSKAQNKTSFQVYRDWDYRSQSVNGDA